MEKICLSFYELVVYPRRKTKETQILGNLAHASSDIFQEMQRFFDTIPKYNPSKIDVQAALVENVFAEVVKPNGRHISGTLRHGSKGFQSSFYDKTGRKSFERTPHHLELMPFYFLVDVPANTKSGLLCFQSFGPHSVCGKVRDALQEYLGAIYGPDYTVKIQFLYIGVIDAKRFLKQGRVKSIAAIKHFAAADVASDNSKKVKCVMNFEPVKRGAVFKKSLNEALIGLSAVLVPKRDEVISTVQEFLSVDLSDVLDLEFKVKLGEETRKIDLNDLSKSATRIDISQQVSRESTGHPNFSSIDALAKNILLRDIRSIIR